MKIELWHTDNSRQEPCEIARLRHSLSRTGKNFILFSIALFSVIYTINGQIPAPQIDYCSVNPETGLIELHWNYSFSEIDGFIVKRKIYEAPGVIPGSFVTVATINNPNQRTYADISTAYGVANPKERAESYCISAFRYENHELKISSLSEVHETIFPQTEFEYCPKTVLISFSQYVGWESVSTYNLFLISGLDTLEYDRSKDTFFLFNVEKLDIAYRFFVKANSFGGKHSFSPIFVVNTPQPEIPEFLSVDSVVSDNQTVRLRISCEYTTDSHQVQLYSRNSETDLFAKVSESESPQSIVYQSSVSENMMFLTLTDYCGDIILKTDTFQNIDIEMLNISTRFAEFSVTNELFGTYSLTRTYKGSTNTWQVEPAEHFTDDISVLYNSDYFNDNSSSDVCYSLIIQDDTRNRVYVSNTLCAEPPTDIQIPNTIIRNSPNEIDRQFRVFGAFLTDFTLVIFDAYGQILFQSNNQTETWNGTYQNGLNVPQSSYPYVLVYSDDKGILHKIKGFVTVLDL